jgi:hypothetical protein
MKRFIAGLMLVVGGAVPAYAQVPDVQDFSSVVRRVRDPVDVNQVNLRIITPFWVATRNGAGVPTSVAIRFRLYNPTSATPTSVLFQSGARSFALPALPCTNAASFDDDFSLRFFGRWNGMRQTVAVNYRISCTESGSGVEKETFRTIVYSADVTQAGGSTWGRLYTLPLIAANALDLLNGSNTLGQQDGIGETLMLTLEAATGPRIVFLNFDTGAAFSNPAWTMPADRTYNVGDF